MRRFFGKRQADNIIIEGSEFEHLKRVLRMKEGDKLIASINDNYDYYCTIEKMEKTFSILSIDEKVLCKALPKKEITLFQMMPKKEYFDSIVAKSIELGISELYFFKGEYSMIKEIKLPRFESQIMTACKQCERSKLIKANQIISFEEMLEKLKQYPLVIFANEREDKPLDEKIFKGKDKIALVIGNEAGFSEKEAKQIIDSGAKSISLGSRILRCDTAVTSLLSLTNFFTGN